MSLVDPALAGRVKADREANAESVKAKDAQLQAELKG